MSSVSKIMRLMTPGSILEMGPFNRTGKKNSFDQDAHSIGGSQRRLNDQSSSLHSEVKEDSLPKKEKKPPKNSFPLDQVKNPRKHQEKVKF